MPVVPPGLGLNKPHLCRHSSYSSCDVLCLDNGGDSGSGYWVFPFALRLRGPFDVSVQAGFQLLPLSVQPF